MSSAALCTLVRKSLGAETGLRNPNDGIACLAHACMLSSGFTFIGLGEDHVSDKQISSASMSALPNEWNSSNSSTYMFRYTHPNIEKDYIMRISRLGAKTMIFGGGNNDDKTITFEVLTEHYTTAANYPWKEGTKTPLADAFVSMSRIKEFSNLFTSKMSLDGSAGEPSAQFDIQEPIRSQPLEGRASQSVRPADPSMDTEPRLPRPDFDPLRSPPRPNPVPSDWPPEFDDEHQMQGRHGGSGLGDFRGSRGFPSIGADDLRPPGIDAMNPLRDDRPHRGMYPTPEDILFPHRGEDPREGSGLGRRPPPGARYDPVFPGDQNGFRRGRGPGQGGFNPFGGVGGMNNDSMFG